MFRLIKSGKEYMLLIICSVCFFADSISQQTNTSLYLQTSEMSDAMIQFDADKASILRFYAAGSSRSTFGRQTGINYNTPERRNRLLQLITDNLNNLKKLPFEKWNSNGQVDYILFKRNLENEQYQLLQEEKLYVQIAPLLPFADKLMELQKPRRRGLNVNGEAVAKSLNDINKEIVTAIGKLKKGDSLESAQANMTAIAANALQTSLKDYFNFYNDYDPLFSW